MSEDAEVRKLQEQVNLLIAERAAWHKHLDGFDTEDYKDAREVVVFWRRIRSLGWFGRYLFYALLAFGAILPNMDRITEWWKSL